MTSFSFHDSEIGRLAELAARLNAHMQTGGAPASNTTPLSTPPPADTFGLGTIPTNAPTTQSGFQPITPNMASASQYLMTEIGGDSVNLGFGLPNSGTMTINQALTWFLALPPNQLAQIESQMWAAGLYVAGNNGQPLETPPIFGSKDPQSTAAFIQLLSAAYDQQTSASTVLAQYQQEGLGANNRATLPSAALGGGNTYTIDLTNPADVTYAATSIFQAALGRNPTAAEDAAITNAVNSQTLAQGYAQEQTAEGQSKARYQAQVTQRNIAYEYETTPKVYSGAIPNGPISNPEQWAVTLLQSMGDPTTSSNIQFVTGWISKTGAGMGGFNPLGSLYQAPGSTPGKSGGAPLYASWAQGIQATVQALNSGAYGNTLAALASGTAMQQASNPAIQAEIGKWSGGAYSTVPAGPQTPAEAAAAAASQVSPGSGPQVRQGMNANNAAMVGAPPEQAATPGTTTAVPGSSTTIPPADVTPGQQITNPGDQYISPATSITTNPASPSAAAYQEATTGANRPAFLGNEYLNAYQAILDMIKAGGPTTG